MKDILINGHRLLTTDEIADAVLNYARVLAEAGEIDVVEFPTFDGGELSRCSVLLGTSSNLAIVDATVGFTPSLPGSQRAAAAIDSLAAVKA